MRTNYIQRASLVSALLLFLAGCMVNEAVPEPTYIEVKASLSLETKAYLATTETLNLKSKWKGNEKIYVFLRSGEEFLELGDPVSITSVSDDGTSASFRFQIPTSWQSLVTQPGTVINCFTSNCNPVLDDDGRLQLSAPLTRKALAEYEAPIYCEGVVENRTLYANFHHLWVYELLHFTNKSSKACDFSLCGFNAPSGDVWYAYNGKVYFDSGLSAGINSRGSAGSANATKAGDLTKSPIVTVGPGASDIIVSSYYPTGGKIKDAQLVAEIDGEFKYSTNTKSSTVELQRGHAYHMYAEWDGSELKFVDAPKDEAFELSSTDVVFDDTAIGSKSKKCITVKNTGTKALTFSISSVNDSDIFSWSPEEPTCLGPGDESEIEITFMPETEGTVTGFLDFSLDGLTCAAVIKCTGNGVFSTIPDDIVIERDFQINLHHVYSYQGGQYFSSQRFVIEFDNNIYWRVSYQYDDYAQKHGVFIDAGEGVDDSVKKRYLEEKTTEVIYDEWVHEKICIGKDGSVSYFQNGVLLGSFQAPEMSLDESQSFRVLVNPYGWWTGHYQWMDNFSFQYGSDYFFDDFNSGMLDTNLWNISDAVTGSVYVEDGFVKCNQISTDKNCKLASRWFSFDGLSPEPEYIDLELPSGIKWATCNLGAITQEEYGDHYAWGEIEPKSDYSWSTYKWCSGSNSSITKYCTDASYGTVDNKVLLDPEDDVATVKLGGKWRMPTLDEFQELFDNCNAEWTTKKGVQGAQLTSKSNGKIIFFPAAGCRRGTSLSGVGSVGAYLSKTLDPNRSDYANLMSICMIDTDGWGLDNRCYGLSVRPVWSETQSSTATIDLSTTDINFGEVAVGSSKSEDFTVTNTGNADLVFEFSSLNAPYSINASGMQTLAAGGHQNYKVTFAPTSASQSGSRITITSNASNGSQSISLTGIGAKASEVTPGEAVDLGLPSGIKWASCNLGASKPEEYGGYYQWAGAQDVTDTNIYLDSSNCPYHTGSSYYTGWTKYITSDYSSIWSGAGNPDNKTVLDSEDDVAHVILGGNWRMPTKDEFQELIDNCTAKWTTMNRIYGRRFTSKKNGNSIFLPAAGCRNDDYLYYVGSRGYYWSSSLYTDTPYDAYDLHFNSASVYSDYYYRYYGQSVRPVSE